jgi:hypothetical protein
MALLAAQVVSIAGLNPTYAAAAAGGDEFANNGRRMLHVQNGSGSSITVTITTPGTTAGLSIADPAVTVPNSGSRMIGPFPTGLYNAADGNVDVAYSAVTSVTVAVIELPA